MENFQPSSASGYEVSDAFQKLYDIQHERNMKKLYSTNHFNFMNFVIPYISYFVTFNNSADVLRLKIGVLTENDVFLASRRISQKKMTFILQRVIVKRMQYRKI